MHHGALNVHTCKGILTQGLASRGRHLGATLYLTKAPYGLKGSPRKIWEIGVPTSEFMYRGFEGIGNHHRDEIWAVNCPFVKFYSEAPVIKVP